MTAGVLFEEALVWDNIFPTSPICGAIDAHLNVLSHMKELKYDVVSLTVATDTDNASDALTTISFWRKYLRDRANEYLILERAGDVEAARSQGKLAVGFNFQGTAPFERDLGLVEVFYKLGVRQALLAYNQKNSVGDGCHERTDAGLSRFGIELIAEMNRVGMVVDCTHTGLRTSLDAFEASTAPVIYSHSNARALTDHERNISDEMARTCAQLGGVVGVNGLGIFLGNNDASTEAFFRHIDHWVQLIGAEHVGIGLDSVSEPDVLTRVVRADQARYPASQGYGEEFRIVRPAQLPELTELMLRAGYSNDAVRGVLGENWLRIARAVWK